MSKIPYRFIGIPEYFLTTGWTKDPIMCQLLIYLFARIQYEPHTEFINGKEVKLDAFEFIFGRDSVSRETGLSPRGVRTRIGQIAASNKAIKVASKSTSKYTVYKWVTSEIGENEVQQNGQQNGQQMGRHIGQQAASTAATNKSEEAKREDVEKTYSLAGSPPSSFFSNVESLLSQPIEYRVPHKYKTAFEAAKSFGFQKTIDMFLFADGSSINPKVLSRWLKSYLIEDVVMGMIWIIERERQAKSKGRKIKNPEAYLEKGLAERLWEAEEIQDNAKIIDIEQAQRHRRGA